MTSPPDGAHVTCPHCGSEAVAIVPKDSTVTEGKDNADGSVWVTCRHCGERFRVFFRNDR